MGFFSNVQEFWHFNSLIYVLHQQQHTKMEYTTILLINHLKTLHTR